MRNRVFTRTASHETCPSYKGDTAAPLEKPWGHPPCLMVRMQARSPRKTTVTEERPHLPEFGGKTNRTLPPDIKRGS